MTILAETVSLCPECLQRISARKVSENGNIYLEKECAHHGRFKTLIWRGDLKHYMDWGEYGVTPVPPFERLSDINRGCPYDCGLCPSHRANTCSMIMLVTSRCNISCPVCLAGSGPPLWDEPDLNTIERMYNIVLRTTGRPSIQLSGGEPTVRDDLPEI
ncbi:MAG: radical SAM protein, partial [Deltaproteobacteria bacterium]|nr:radical SAM protein [Deltaproteobacteria bacterium]